MNGSRNRFHVSDIEHVTPTLLLQPRRWCLLRLCADLESLSVTEEEIQFLRSQCPYFPDSFLQYLQSFRLNPRKHVRLEYHPVQTGNEESAEVRSRFPYSTSRVPLIFCIGKWPHYHNIRDLVWDYPLRNPTTDTRIWMLFSIQWYRLGLYQSRRECIWERDETAQRGLCLQRVWNKKKEELCSPRASPKGLHESCRKIQAKC